MIQLDERHPTVEALRKLTPDAVIAGGSFASSLPHPKDVPAATRESVINAARETANSLCIKNLLTHAGHDPDTVVSRKSDGSRDWPAPFLGSLTHKGTVVLGALFHRSKFEVGGIDLELLEKQKPGLAAALIAPEGLPTGIDPAAGVTCSFSAKESVFKAQYPTTLKRLDFRDVQLLDFIFHGKSGSGTARLDGFPDIPVSVLIVDPWIVSVALLRKNSV